MSYYIFIDESGDLGFNFKKNKTSKYFIVTFILSKDKGVLDKIIKKVFKSFSKTEIKKALWNIARPQGKS